MSEDKIQETIDKYKRCEVWMAVVSVELLDAELMNNAENSKAYATLTKAISDAANGPVDADGETWHVGDMSDSPSGTIEEIDYADGQWRVRGHGVSPWVPADILRHYHKPTVEAMLREFWTDADAVENGDEFDGIVDKYAAEIGELLKEDW